MKKKTKRNLKRNLWNKLMNENSIIMIRAQQIIQFDYP